ncbi:MAG TPA: hypothetical protein VGQ20_07645 [Acidimicrobiales bacterium]|nr:hypothetical protein [Acidimicrobiales bacterium]
MTRRTLRALLATSALAASITILGCGDTDGASPGAAPGGPDEPTSTLAPPPSASTGPGDPGTAKVVPSRTDLVNEHPATPTLVAADPADNRILRVRFWGGVVACHGARVAVTESATTVTVALFAGTVPEGVGKMCIELAELQEIRVTLAAPLGTRTLTVL